MFALEGLNKTVVALASNLIGAHQIKKMGQLIFSAIKLHFVIVALVAIPLLVAPQWVIEVFLAKVGTTGDKEEIIRHGVISLYAVWIYYLIDGFPWIFSGVLIAGKDTKAVMVINATNAWLFAVLPVLIGIYYFNMPPGYIWWMIICYTIVNAIMFYWRYASRHWEKNAHVESEKVYEGAV